ncbi:M56 family metallopeptidase [Dyella acidiphila]|uniref:Peptidase M56 n=1 Tax=Dyella acidiphila TaxID=2775866 RepID=A0ABR9G610_9GAMM|nr:M56 family metallopeptidase [Dyella acidiphila]MBE1159444.1 peptidase M56 [Dyella acidiphila]
MDTLFDLADSIFLRLAWAAAQATVLIGALWLLSRWVPRLSPAIRCMLWWLVAAQLIVGMTVNAPIELHWLPAQHVTAVVTHTAMPATGTGARVSAVMTTVANDDGAEDLPAWSWQRSLVVLWLLGVLLQALFALRQWHANRALVRASQPLRDASLQLLCAEQAHALGLRHVPHLRISAAITSPQVTGWWRPLVLLPAQQNLSSEELGMALAHELAHLHRGDLWLGWVPAIAQRLFFFHPLVVWAMREYAIYREAACDAQVVQHQHAAPHSYGHLLLRLGVAHPPHAGLAGASSTFQNLKRRLTLLQQSDAMPRTHGWLLVGLIAVIGILPYRVTATSVVQDAVYTAPPAPPAPPAAPALPAAPAPVAPLAAAAIPAPPAPPPAPPAPPAPPHAFGFARHVDIDTTANASQGIALFDGDTVMINGSDADEATAQRLHNSGNPLLWFRRGNRAYVVHDDALIQQAKRAYVPIAEMARAQGELAGKQGELAGQQGGIAARQGALANREAQVADRRAQLEAARASAQASQEAGREAGFTGQLAGITAEEQEISRENRELEQEAAQMSKRAEALAKQQTALSAQQEDANRRAEQELDKVLDKAIAQGLAQPAAR